MSACARNGRDQRIQLGRIGSGEGPVDSPGGLLLATIDDQTKVPCGSRTGLSSLIVVLGTRTKWPLAQSGMQSL